MGNLVGTHIAVLKDVETVEVVYLESAIIATTHEEMIKPLLEEKKSNSHGLQDIHGNEQHQGIRSCQGCLSHPDGRFHRDC